MSTYTIASAKLAMKHLPPEIAVLLRGETGIGKSFIVHQVAKEFGMKVVDRRLSQMTEGDLLGLPSINDATTQFNPPDWYHESCHSPVALFMDEMNRATRELQQGAFQLVLDRELNGYKLHKETRVYSAVNVGGKYSVNEMDAALLRRFFVIDLAPDANDWIAYAKEIGINELIIGFIQGTPTMLDPAQKSPPGSVQPTRASWERLDRILGLNKISDDPANPLYFNLAKGMIGAEVASALIQFGKTFQFQVSGEDVWYRFADPKAGIENKMKKLGQEQWLGVIDRAVQYCKRWNVLPNECKPHLKAFFHAMPIELRPETWGKIVMHGSLDCEKKDHTEWAKSIHPSLVYELVTEVFGVPLGKAGINVKPNIPKLLLDRLNKSGS